MRTQVGLSVRTDGFREKVSSVLFRGSALQRRPSVMDLLPGRPRGSVTDRCRLDIPKSQSCLALHSQVAANSKQRMQGCGKLGLGYDIPFGPFLWSKVTHAPLYLRCLR